VSTPTREVLILGFVAASPVAAFALPELWAITGVAPPYPIKVLANSMIVKEYFEHFMANKTTSLRLKTFMQA